MLIPSRRSVFCSCVFAASAAVMLASPSLAQCSREWSPGAFSAGTNGIVYATTFWDPDGAGPQPELLVVAGSFRVAGDRFANSIAACDLATGRWSTFGDGFLGRVRCLAVMPNGDLVAGGVLDNGGGEGVARWDGTTWVGLSFFVSFEGVRDLIVLANGDLVAVGEFYGAGGVSANGIARWDGIAWHAFGSGLESNFIYPKPDVFAVVEMPNGDIVVGGDFAKAGGVPAMDLARWDGSAWSAWPTTPPSGIRALQVDANGDLVCGGWFQDHVTRWDGAAWQPMPGLNSSVWSFGLLPNGELLAGGLFNVGGQVRVARWNGSGWLAFGGGLSYWVTSISVLSNGDVIAGGDFVAGSGAVSVARSDGQDWQPISPGRNGPDGGVQCIAVLPSGDFVIGGAFGAPVLGIARGDGTTWYSMGFTSGVPVRAMGVLPSGDLILGVLRWNGQSWFPMPGWQLQTQLNQMLVLANGDAIAASGIMQYWDGSTWSQMPSLGGLGGPAEAVAQLPNGDVIIGMRSGGQLLRWDGGSSYLPFATTNGVVSALEVLPNGDLIAGGEFTQIGGQSCARVARWNGVTWSPLGAGFATGRVDVVEVLPDGDLLAGGQQLNVTGSLISHLARWDGNQWMQVANPLYGMNINTIASLPNGDVLIGGGHFLGPVQGAHCIARLSTTCPATTTTFGSGCAGSAGPAQLTATSLPWIGASAIAHASGMHLLGAAIGVHGFQQLAVSLPALLSQAQPGCDLLVSPDIVSLHLPIQGEVDVELQIPNAAVFIGQQHHLQVLGMGLDAQLQFVELTSTNALTLTIGSL